MPCLPDTKMCFACLIWFHKDDAILCDKCKQYKCRWCDACGCTVSHETMKAIHALQETYDRWIKENCCI
jgi:hypothetical protein